MSDARGDYYGRTCENLRREIRWLRRVISDVAYGTKVATLFRCTQCGRRWPGVIPVNESVKCEVGNVECMDCRSMTGEPVYPADLGWNEKEEP